MDDLLTSMKDKELIATEQQKILDHNFSGIAKELTESHIANTKVQPNLNLYSDEVRQFAMTLHYYSPKAYEFVCQVLKLQRILAQNSIEPSKTGNSTPFEDSLTQVGGLVSFSSKSQMADPVIETSDQNAILAELMILLNDINNPTPTERQHTILHCWAHCSITSGKSFLWDMQRGTTAWSYWCTCFTTVHGPLVCHIHSLQAKRGISIPINCCVQCCQVIESVFHRHVVGAGTNVPNEKNTDLKIQSTVFEQMSIKVFSTNPAHLFDHKLGEERDHTSSLL